jgi:hypothetical protein
MSFRKSLISAFILLCAVPALLAPAALAQNALKNDDIAVSGLYEMTQTVSGNGITVKASKSSGGQAAFRHSFHYWMGYEGAYSYTRYTDVYTGQPFGIQHNQHEFSASYLVHGPTILVQPFALAGISALIFSPSLNGGQNVTWQARPGINFAGGVNVPLLTSHIGLRIQYRGVYYKAPDYNRTVLKTNATRLTSEPMAGLYLKF